MPSNTGYLLFDWGGTLMRVMPRWCGHELGWTTEEPTPYAQEVLTQLHDAGWRMSLASNASESAEEPIRECLNTMGVGGYMEQLYTWRKIGSPKPWAPFWRAIIQDVALPPERFVMIGDDWMGDVWGAQQAGMYAIWFNPHTEEVRERERVVTIHDMRELPKALETLLCTSS